MNNANRQLPVDEIMDKKEKAMLAHYKKIIEHREFDEYDILGFLIFVRRHIGGDCNYIQEFADLIAHRERDRGIVVSCISAAIDNEYRNENDGKQIVGYKGMQIKTWYKQWKKLGEKLYIKIDENIIEEITLCIFSLAQFTQYDDGKGHSGKIDIMQNKSGALALATSEKRPDSLYICFAKTKKEYVFIREFSAGHLIKPVETIREQDILRLRDKDEYII